MYENCLFNYGLMPNLAKMLSAQLFQQGMSVPEACLTRTNL